MKMLQTGSRYLSPAPDIMTDKWPWRPRPPTFQQWVSPLHKGTYLLTKGPRCKVVTPCSQWAKVMTWSLNMHDTMRRWIVCPSSSGGARLSFMSTRTNWMRCGLDWRSVGGPRIMWCNACRLWWLECDDRHSRTAACVVSNGSKRRDWSARLSTPRRKPTYQDDDNYA